MSWSDFWDWERPDQGIFKEVQIGSDWAPTEADPLFWVTCHKRDVVHGYYHLRSQVLPAKSEGRRSREDKASSREAGPAFLLVMFSCDCHGNTKCQKQIQRFAISQLVCFLDIHMVIFKRVSTFTRKAHATLFALLTHAWLPNQSISCHSVRYNPVCDGKTFHFHTVTENKVKRK